MPGPVCVQNASSEVPVFDCEPFEITGEANPIGPPPPPTAASPAAAPAPPPPPAVKLLMDAVIERVEIPGIQAPIVNNPEKCIGEIDAMTIALLSKAKSLTLALLGLFKVSYDVGKCEGKERVAVSNELSEAKAEQYCIDDGGKPRQWVGNTLQCVYPEQQVQP